MTHLDERMEELNYSFLHDNERERGDALSHIRELEKRLTVELPPEYREFLALYGGATFGDTFEAPITEAGHTAEYACPTAFYGFYKPKSNGSAHSLDLRDIIRYYKDRVPAGSIPIAQAIGGNLILLRVVGKDRGKVSYWDHESSQVLSVAPSFGEFLANLTLTDTDDGNDD
jgi:hypothetical protein